MVRRGIRTSLSLVVALMGCALPAAAQDGAFWSFQPPGRTLPRCHESTLAHKDADARLTLLDEYLDRVPDTPDVAAAVHEVHALLKSDCFLPAAETDRILNPDSTLALKRWWLDGGRSWLASYLKLPEQGEITKLRPHVVLPPDTRRTLIVSSDPDDPLRPLMCRLDDAACGVETVGWIQRAESSFDAHHVVHLNDDVRLLRGSLSPTAPTAEAAAERCAADLPSATNTTRYQAWRLCLESQ